MNFKSKTASTIIFVIILLDIYELELLVRKLQEHKKSPDDFRPKKEIHFYSEKNFIHVFVICHNVYKYGFVM